MSSRSATPENDIFSLSIVPDRENKPAGTTNTDFDGLLPKPLLLYEDLKGGCGGQLWPAGMTLAKYMLKYHADLRGKSIIEIGAGGGLVGLAVATGCLTSNDRKLLITDQIPMLSLMQKNIVLNDLTTKVEAAVYDWGEDVPAEVASQIQSTEPKAKMYPDVVLAADCVYFEPAFPLLLQTLTDLIGPSTICYFCFKKRRKADMRCIRDLRKKFIVQEIDYESSVQDQRDSIFVNKVTARDDGVS
ncbi:Protein-lysine N-methyltransferase efm6 [Knufia obscura]|uniref:Protein-lysine N-methyltransferase EFM6 n=2 Tax=Knufia TaxID=430999 RepID=A0AAN8EUX4_9EURO|nr:Protein-lysine N-methyltransferase efm6 [Knufia obscura]KAK5956535.1 Protein-lysine N-methyltransferase efm6 [Knufia fluminis]